MDVTQFTEAKMQFIRVVDRLAETRKISWKVVGDFVKNIILHTESSESPKLEIMMINKGTSMGTIDIIKDLYIMKFVTHWTNNEFRIETKVEIFVGNTRVDLECIFYENYYACVMASDQIVLTPNGLSVSYFGDICDVRNMNRGIALMQRLSDLQIKRDSLIMIYINSPNDLNMRKRNASIMRRQCAAAQKGYTITGNILQIDKKEKTCPICYETQCSNATLECTHQFCVECLASHMERAGDSHSKCPLCRQPLFLKLVDQF